VQNEIGFKPKLTPSEVSVVNGGAVFVRGDTTTDGVVSITDAISTFGFLFRGNPTELFCEDSADADDNGSIEITDGILTLNFLFQGGAEIAAPYPACGVDPSEDALGCASNDSCQ
ncbi:MAG: hypothetical protein AAF517_06800, partial [Planctomycetota bacterium]